MIYLNIFLIVSCLVMLTNFHALYLVFLISEEIVHYELVATIELK